MSERLTLALPTDIYLDWFDTTVTATQLSNNAVLASADDFDALASMVEGAEDEFRQLTNAEIRLSRAGTAGNVETYEQQTYAVKGHEAFKRTWARTARDYRPTEAEINLNNGRILPFDSTEGDEVRIYRGMNSNTNTQWADVTDKEGDLWTILDHGRGVLALHPVEIHRAMMGTTGQGVGIGTQRRDVRIAISYRYGSLGGGRSVAGATELGASLTESDTPDALALDDAGRLPGAGTVVLLIGTEYVLADVDVSNDTVDVLERGLRGTSPESHDEGARVQYTPPAIRKAIAARAGMSLVNSGRYSAWLPDSDDEVGKGDMFEAMSETWNRTVEALS